jgi:predicted nucleic acid-binding protein
MAISCLTLAELKVGPFGAPDPLEQLRRGRHVKRLEAQVAMLPFETAAASAFGRVHAAVSAIGRKPRGTRAVDLMIAATACAHEMPLYTRNAADLRGLEDLIEIVDLTG